MAIIKEVIMMGRKEIDQEAHSKVNKHTEAHEKDRNALDNFQNQKFADDIPLDDLNIETEQEKDKRKTQDTSQSERKFKKDKY